LIEKFDIAEVDDERLPGWGRTRVGPHDKSFSPRRRSGDT